jgi:hypothetical protein
VGLDVLNVVIPSMMQLHTLLALPGCLWLVCVVTTAASKPPIPVCCCVALSCLLLLQLHIFERTRMQHKGAAVLVGVNGLLALEAIDRDLLDGLLQKAIRLEGSGVLWQQ